MLVKALHKLNQGIDRVYMLASGILFIILIVASTLQVFTRYVLNASLVGTEEAARYCFIWMSLLGASIAVGRWAHTSISVLYDLLSGIPKKGVFCLQNLFVIALGVIFIMGGVTMMQATATQFTPTLHIPRWIIYLGVPLSGLGMCLHAVEHILETLAGERKDLEEEKA